MSTRMPWFRMYVDFLNDPKLIRLAFEDQRHFIGVLALKSDGALDDGTDAELLNRIVAQRLWIDHAVIREVKKRLVAAGLITEDWQPIAWERRQFKSDSSKDRVARFRAKKKGDDEGGDEGGNGDETLQKRKSNAVDADTDTDTEETVNNLKIVGAQSDAEASPAATPAATRSKKSSEKRAHRLPDDWVLPKKWGDWALGERTDLTADDVRRESAIFADYWQSMGGQRARKVDWFKTWCNWVRRCNDRKPAAARSGSAAADNKHSAAFNAILGED